MWRALSDDGKFKVVISLNSYIACQLLNQYLYGPSRAVRHEPQGYAGLTSLSIASKTAFRSHPANDLIHSRVWSRAELLIKS